jgi:hypothetical protein
MRLLWDRTLEQDDDHGDDVEEEESDGTSEADSEEAQSV